MQGIIFAIGLMIIAAVVMAVTHRFHNGDVEMSSSIEENKRISDLTEKAMTRYPDLPMMRAMQRYVWDMEERIETMRANAVGTDVLYAIESDLKECQLLREEISRLIKMEIDINSHFNVLHAAQS
ncbi:MAG: hypothetical protein Q8L88_02390 [Bacteroidota bacterium]|nr:hypothetical protein [Bacteroidota bacterium]